jgi:hypothetical protein
MKRLVALLFVVCAIQLPLLAQSVFHFSIDLRATSLPRAIGGPGGSAELSVSSFTPWVFLGTSAADYGRIFERRLGAPPEPSLAPQTVWLPAPVPLNLYETVARAAPEPPRTASNRRLNGAQLRRICPYHSDLAISERRNPANHNFRAQAGCQRRRCGTRAVYSHPEATPRLPSGHLVANR